MKTLDQQLALCVPRWTRLLKSLKPDIQDDFRADEFDDSGVPSMCVTIGFTPETEEKDCSWGYQTGGNSYTGGAYDHRHWAVLTIHRRSNCKDLAIEAAEEIAESVTMFSDCPVERGVPEKF